MIKKLLGWEHVCWNPTAARTCVFFAHVFCPIFSISHPILEDQIFGLSVSARWNSHIFQIWNMESSLKDNATVMTKVEQILGRFEGIEIISPFYKGTPGNCQFSRSIRCPFCFIAWTTNKRLFPSSLPVPFIAHKDHDNFNM